MLKYIRARYIGFYLLSGHSSYPMYPYAHCTRVFCWGKSIVPVIQLYDLSQKIILKWHLLAHQRHATHINSVSITQQFYNRLPIRKKYIRAIKRGTLIYDRGQVTTIHN